MHHPTDRIAHNTAFVTPVVEHWLEREIAQWVHPMKDRSDDPSHHELTLLPRKRNISHYVTLFDSEVIFYTHIIFLERLGSHWKNLETIFQRIYHRTKRCFLEHIFISLTMNTVATLCNFAMKGQIKQLYGVNYKFYQNYNIDRLQTNHISNKHLITLSCITL